MRDLQPLSIVRRKGFRDFCFALHPQYVLPTTATLRKTLLPRLDNYLMAQIREDLQKVRHVAMTSDGWSSKVIIIAHLNK